MTASDVVVGAAAPAVKVRLASFALNGHVRLGLGAVIYLVEAEGRFVLCGWLRLCKSFFVIYVFCQK